MNPAYIRTVQLLLDVAPAVFDTHAFAEIHGNPDFFTQIVALALEFFLEPGNFLVRELETGLGAIAIGDILAGDEGADDGLVCIPLGPR